MVERNGDKNVKKKNGTKRIFFSVEYGYPEEMPDDVILDRFAEQILDDASTVNEDDIRIVNENEREIHCPKCGNPLRVSGKIEEYRGLGIVEHDAYCDKCDITVNVEDRSTYGQEGKILITFA